MPTAVERLLQAFLKLEIDNPFEQRGLAAAFSHIDADFEKITHAANRRDLVLAERAAAQDFHKIADVFHDTGEYLSRLARFSSLVDNFFLKIAPPTSTPQAAVEGGGIHLQDDFLELDAALADSGQQLKIFGNNIRRMDGSVTPAEFVNKMHASGDDALKLASAMGDDEVGFERMSDDFLALADVNSDGRPANSLDYDLGNALHKIAGDFGALQADFLKLNVALGGRGEPVVTLASATEATNPLSPGQAFHNAYDDFLNLSHDLTGVAAPAAAGLNALLRNAFGAGGGTAFP